MGKGICEGCLVVRIQFFDLCEDFITDSDFEELLLYTAVVAPQATGLDVVIKHLLEVESLELIAALEHFHGFSLFQIADVLADDSVSAVLSSSGVLENGLPRAAGALVHTDIVILV